MVISFLNKAPIFHPLVGNAGDVDAFCIVEEMFELVEVVEVDLEHVVVVVLVQHLGHLSIELFKFFCYFFDLTSIKTQVSSVSSGRYDWPDLGCILIKSLKSLGIRMTPDTGGPM